MLPNMMSYLDREYLKEMGITPVGDIIAILRHAETYGKTGQEVSKAGENDPNWKDLRDTKEIVHVPQIQPIGKQHRPPHSHAIQLQQYVPPGGPQGAFPRTPFVCHHSPRIQGSYPGVSLPQQMVYVQQPMQYHQLSAYGHPTTAFVTPHHMRASMGGFPRLVTPLTPPPTPRQKRRLQIVNPNTGKVNEMLMY